MEQGPHSDQLLLRAKEAEMAGRWSEAASIHEEASRLPGMSPLIVAGSLRHAGQCMKRMAFESHTREDFERMIHLARKRWSGALALLADAKDDAKFVESLLNQALIKRVDAWLATNCEQKLKLLKDCYAFLMNGYQHVSDSFEAYQSADLLCELMDALMDVCEIERDWEARGKFMEQAAGYGKLAVREYSRIGDERGLARAHRLLASYSHKGSFLSSTQSEREKHRKATPEFCTKAVQLATNAGDPIELGLSLALLGYVTGNYLGDSKAGLELADKAVQTAELSKDRLLKATVLERWCEAALLFAHREEDPTRKSELAEKSLRLADQARQNLWTVKGDFSPLASEILIHGVVEPNLWLATDVETTFEKKKERLEAALDIGDEAVKVAENSGSPVSIMSAHHAGSKVEYALAFLETEEYRKRTRLEDALKHRKEAINCLETAMPHDSSIGIDFTYLADIQLELARMEPNHEKRRALLEEAAAIGRRSLPYLWDYLLGSHERLGFYYEKVAAILSELYSANSDEETLKETIHTFEEAAHSYRDGGILGRAGEAFWQMAKSLDRAGKFSDASRIFKEAFAAYSLAAEKYKVEAKKIPSLSSIFGELADYMQAWVEIEDARSHHGEEDYAAASERYAKAADTLRATKTWNYLSSICSARSLLEKGEELSRAERHSESIESISSALGTFTGSKKELEDKLGNVGGASERQELKDWLKVAYQREPYCQGRRELEEARVLEKKGEKAASSSKYTSAAETFKALAVETDSIQDRGEYQMLAQFCEAWAKMKTAELKAAPELFAEAAESFMKANESTTQDRFRFLALANASICRALEAGTRFRLTRDTGLYSEIKKQLETAADYYQEAGFEKTGSWTRATQRLFDALVYLTEAETEKDPKKKTEFYHLAEKHFELAAKLYGEAGFPRKKEEALRDLGRAREEKQLLLATMQTIAEIPSASGASITSLTLKEGPAVGLERFEQASVIGNLSVPERDLHVGSDLIFELEMANVGRATATLIKLANLVPEGFEIEREKNPYRIEGDLIDMRGKRLEHLKMHEMKVVLTPVRKGTFVLRPRILFADDKGSHRWHDFEPVTLTVRELGISGWLRGPGSGKPSKETAPERPRLEEPRPLPSGPVTIRAEIPSDFRFETERAKEVFQHLVTEFLKDYMAKRLYVEKAGWRSLMEVVRETKIPRSAVYGPSGRSGPVLQELEHRGLIEARIFLEERGRGGEITKVRIAYENEIVKRIVEKMVMDNA